MPYIITTRTFSDPGVQSIWQHTRIAVATLEEARAECQRIWPIARDGYVHRVVTADGGTIGPLPDGTVIEVRPA